MKVAIFHPYLKEKGGAEKVVLETAKGLDAETRVFTLNYESEDTFQEFQEINITEIFGLDPKGFVRKGLTFTLGSLLSKIDWDYDKLIVSETGLSSFITFRNKNAICYCHTPLRIFIPEFADTYKEELPGIIRPFYGFMKSVFNRLEKHFWKNYHGVIANSETTKKRIISKDLVEEVSVINPGAKIDREKGSYEKYFFYPSRFRQYKRQDFAIKAFQKANPKGFKLILAGSGQDPEYIEELKEMADEKVEIKTDVPDEAWQKLYQNCYTVLFCAENEDWGIIPIEAGSYSKPVISVNEGGPTESIIDGETGFLVDNEEKMAEKIRQLAENPDKVRDIGGKAREHSKKYSWSNFVRQLSEKLDTNN